MRDHTAPPADRAKLSNGKKAARSAMQACRRAVAALTELEDELDGDVFGSYVWTAGDDAGRVELDEFIALAAAEHAGQKLEITVIARQGTDHEGDDEHEQDIQR
jgi:streptomycin 6-kinase